MGTTAGCLHHRKRPTKAKTKILLLAIVLLIPLMGAILAAPADFVRTWGWGVDTGTNAFEICTPASLPCQAGLAGGGAGQFDVSYRVTADSAGNVYVADYNNHRIQQFDSSANFVRTWGWGVDTGTPAFEICTPTSLPCQAGIQGSGAGQFDFPIGVAVDSAGNVYVTDYFNHRIQQFDGSGNFVRTWGWGVDTGANAFEVCTPASLPCQAGIQGGGAGQFYRPVDVEVDGADNVYVADRFNHRMQQFDSSAAFVRTWGWGVDTGANTFEVCTPASLPCQAGLSGGGAGQFDFPIGVALDGAGNVYVAGWYNHRIQQFDGSGNFVRTWGWGVDTGANVFEVCTPSSLPCQTGILGGGAGQFYRPVGVEADSAGNVYVAGYFNERIQQFDSSAAFVRTWGWGVDTGANAFEVCTPASLPCQAGLGGGGAGQFNGPTGVALDGAGNVYVAGYLNHRIQMFERMDPNQPPVADAGPDQAVETLTLVTLDGSASSDPDGNLPLSYLWTQTGGPAVTLGDPAVVSPTFSAPSDPAVLTFTLVVTDSLGLPDPTPDEVVVTVINQAPVADAGPDQTVETLTLVTLDGSASNDLDGDLPLTYLWTQMGGPSVAFTPNLSITTFTAPADPTVFIFTLAVTDSLGLSDPTPDVVGVTVANQSPVADAGGDQSVNTLALVTLDGSGSFDPDGDLPLAYLWTQMGGPPVAFTPNLSVTTFSAPSDPAVLTFTLLVIDSLDLADPTPDEVVVTVEGYRIYLPLVLEGQY